MTQDEALKIARNLMRSHPSDMRDKIASAILAACEKARAEEREACAQTVDAYGQDLMSDGVHEYSVALLIAAEAIRRGTKKDGAP